MCRASVVLVVALLAAKEFHRRNHHDSPDGRNAQGEIPKTATGKSLRLAPARSDRYYVNASVQETVLATSSPDCC
jgi:hypothetical protein